MKYVHPVIGRLPIWLVADLLLAIKFLQPDTATQFFAAALLNHP